MPAWLIFLAVEMSVWGAIVLLMLSSFGGRR